MKFFKSRLECSFYTEFNGIGTLQNRKSLSYFLENLLLLWTRAANLRSVFLESSLMDFSLLS